MPVKKIKSEDVKLGMFVSSLDRPWSETPFLFQGFQVREKAELEELKKQCHHVFILVPDEDIELTSEYSTPALRTSNPKLVGRVRYQVKYTAEEEVKIARGSYEKISFLLQDVETVLREDKELPLPKLKESVGIMVDSVSRNPDAYIWLTRIQKFDSHTYKHALSAAVWATSLGRELGFEQNILRELATGALLMDIGNTALPVHIFQKHERLSHEEWALVKSHVEQGVRIVSETPGCSDDVIDIVRTHHERLDGSGYPASLRGGEIPLLGQIAGLVDSYVAVTVPRPFATAISPSNALQMLYRQKERLFDGSLVQSFIQALSTYPSGSIVELSNGDIGVVLSQNPGLRLRPNVILLLDPDKKPYGSYPIINLVTTTHDKEGYPLNIRKTLADGEYGLNIEDLSL